jgi:hypothetical protein
MIGLGSPRNQGTIWRFLFGYTGTNGQFSNSVGRVLTWRQLQRQKIVGLLFTDLYNHSI